MSDEQPPPLNISHILVRPPRGFFARRVREDDLRFAAASCQFEPRSIKKEAGYYLMDVAGRLSADAMTLFRISMEAHDCQIIFKSASESMGDAIAWQQVHVGLMSPHLEERNAAKGAMRELVLSNVNDDTSGLREATEKFLDKHFPLAEDIE